MARTAATEVTVPFTTIPGTWDEVPGRWATWDALTADVATWDELVATMRTPLNDEESG